MPANRASRRGFLRVAACGGVAGSFGAEGASNRPDAEKPSVVCPVGADELASAPGPAGATAFSLAKANAKQPRCVELLQNSHLLDAAITLAGRQ